MSLSADCGRPHVVNYCNKKTEPVVIKTKFNAHPGEDLCVKLPPIQYTCKIQDSCFSDLSDRKIRVETAPQTLDVIHPQDVQVNETDSGMLEPNTFYPLNAIGDVKEVINAGCQNKLDPCTCSVNPMANVTGDPPCPEKPRLRKLRYTQTRHVGCNDVRIYREGEGLCPSYAGHIPGEQFSTGVNMTAITAHAKRNLNSVVPYEHSDYDYQRSCY